MMIRGDTDCDHVLLDVLAEMNAGVEALRDDVSAAVIRRNIEHDVRVPTNQLANFGSNGGRRQARYKQTYSACRLSLVVGNSLQAFAHLSQGRAQSCQQFL